MKNKTEGGPDLTSFKIKDVKISEEKILSHWTGILAKITGGKKKKVSNKR